MSSSLRTPTTELATIAAASSSTSLLITRSLISVFEVMTGVKYSAKDIEQLDELKSLIKSKLKWQDSPIFWNLDKDDKPTRSVDNSKWVRDTDELIHKKGQVQNYRYSAGRIAKIAAAHLTNRNGARGNPEAQFFGEWIDWAINELPTYSYNDTSRIEDRMHYLDAVFSHEKLFTGGFFGSGSAEIRKTLAKIRRELDDCLALAPLEALRDCAHDTFKSCREITKALLMSCAETLYFFRENDMRNEVLVLKDYIAGEAKENPLVGHAAKLYPEIISTHTGAMLHEVIILATLPSFGAPEEKLTTEPSYTYFDWNFLPKPVSWQPNKAGLFKWMKKDEITYTLDQIQQFFHSMLLIVKMKSFLDQLDDLTGFYGDEWAFADNEAKKYLAGFLSIYEENLNTLKKRFDAIILPNRDRVRKLIEHNKIQVQDTININFNMVGRIYAEFSKHHKSLITASQNLRDRMRDFPHDAKDQFEAKKRLFYQEFAAFLALHHKDQASLYQVSESITVTPPAIEVESHRPSINLPVTTPKIVPRKIDTDFKFELKQYSGEKNFWWPNSLHFLLSSNEKTVAHGWVLGFYYSYWMKGFFNRNKILFDQYNQHAETLQSVLTSSISHQEISTAFTRLSEAANAILSKIEHEKPAWRSKLDLWPIQTKGWPFNKEAIAFANQLTSTFELLLQHARTATQNALSLITHEHGVLLSTVASLEGQLKLANKEIVNLKSLGGPASNPPRSNSSPSPTVPLSSVADLLIMPPPNNKQNPVSPKATTANTATQTMGRKH